MVTPQNGLPRTAPSLFHHHVSWYILVALVFVGGIVVLAGLGLRPQPQASVNPNPAAHSSIVTAASPIPIDQLVTEWSKAILEIIGDGEIDGATVASGKIAYYERGQKVIVVDGKEYGPYYQLNGMKTLDGKLAFVAIKRVYPPGESPSSYTPSKVRDEWVLVYDGKEYSAGTGTISSFEAFEGRPVFGVQDTANKRGIVYHGTAVLTDDLDATRQIRVQIIGGKVLIVGHRGASVETVREESGRSTGIISGGTDVFLYDGRDYYETYPNSYLGAIDADGKLAIQVGRGNNYNDVIIVYDGREYQPTDPTLPKSVRRSSDSNLSQYSVLQHRVIHGKDSVLAEKDRKLFVLYDGQEIGRGLITSDLQLIEDFHDYKVNRQLFYPVLKGVRSSRGYHAISNLTELGDAIIYLGERDGVRYVVYNNVELTPARDFGVEGGELTLLVEHSGKQYIVRRGRAYEMPPGYEVQGVFLGDNRMAVDTKPPMYWRSLLMTPFEKTLDPQTSWQLPSWGSPQESKEVGVIYSDQKVENPAANITTDVATGNIGAAGGSVIGKSGVRLDIPAGVLEREVPFTIALQDYTQLSEWLPAMNELELCSVFMIDTMGLDEEDFFGLIPAAQATTWAPLEIPLNLKVPLQNPSCRGNGVFTELTNFDGRMVAQFLDTATLQDGFAHITPPAAQQTTIPVLSGFYAIYMQKE